MRVHVVVPFRNGAGLLAECLASIACQDDPDYTVTVADDASDDPDVARVTKSYAACDGWRIIRRKENLGATQNIVATILDLETTESIPASDVFLLVDGDDRLAHSRVVSRVRAEFEGTGTLVAYGSYRPEPPDDACPPARALPPDILRFGMVRAFTRDHGWWPNHPYAFRRAAYDVLNSTDWTLPDGTPHRYAYDVSLMVPMIEAAGERVVCMGDVSYVYTADRAESVHRVHAEATHAENDHTTHQPRKYQPVVFDPDGEETAAEVP